MLTIEQTVLTIVDVQGKLAELVYDRALLHANLAKAIRGAKVLGLPILWLEQNPARMGRTIPSLRALLEPAEPIAKTAFSCWGEKKFVDALRAAGHRQVVLAGIEAHVCVYQTAMDLVAAGYEVRVLADAVSSRSPASRQTGLESIAACGARVNTVEQFLFELMRTAEHPAFKEILKIVK
jgi:nicotinamidase-related amidase